MKVPLLLLIIASLLATASAYYGVVGCGCEPFATPVINCTEACPALDLALAYHYGAEESGVTADFLNTVTPNVHYHLDSGFFARNRTNLGNMHLPILVPHPAFTFSYARIIGYVSSYVDGMASGSISFFLKGHANFSSPWPEIFYDAEPTNVVGPIKYQVDMTIINGTIDSEEIFFRGDELALTFKVPFLRYLIRLYQNGMQNPAVADAWFNPKTTNYTGPSYTSPFL